MGLGACLVLSARCSVVARWIVSSHPILIWYSYSIILILILVFILILISQVHLATRPLHLLFLFPLPILPILFLPSFCHAMNQSKHWVNLRILYLSPRNFGMMEGAPVLVLVVMLVLGSISLPILFNLHTITITCNTLLAYLRLFRFDLIWFSVWLGFGCGLNGRGYTDARLFSWLAS